MAHSSHRTENTTDREQSQGVAGLVLNVLIETRHKKTGHPVAARVEVGFLAEQDSEGRTVTRLFETGSDGTLGIHISPGEITVSAWANGLVSGMAQAEIDGDHPETFIPLELFRAGELNGSAISGSTGRGVAGAEVFIPTASRGNFAVAGESGDFRFSGIPTDGYLRTIEARAPGYHNGFATLAYDFDDNWKVTSDGMSMGTRVGHRSVPYVTFVLVPEMTFKGTVLSAAGHPVVGASVVVEGSYVTSSRIVDRDRRSSATDSDGAFEVDGLRSGISHSVQITAEGFAQWIQVAETSDRLQRDLGVIILDQEAIISGTVRDWDGYEVSGVEVAVSGKDRKSRSLNQENAKHLTNPSVPGQDARLDSLRFGTIDITDAAGRYQLVGIAEGEYSMAIRKGEGRRLFRETVQVPRAAALVRDVVLPMVPAIKGVVHSGGGPVPIPVNVLLRALDGAELGRTNLDSNARFFFPGLKRGQEYEIWLETSREGERETKLAGRFVPGAANLRLVLGP